MINEQAEAVADELVELGVRRTAAAQFANDGITRSLVEYAVREADERIAAAKHTRKPIRSREGLLVSILKDPGLFAMFDEAERRRSERAQRAEAAREAAAKREAEAARIEHERREALSATWESLGETERNAAIQRALEALRPGIRAIVLRHGGTPDKNPVVLEDAMKLVHAERRSEEASS